MRLPGISPLALSAAGVDSRRTIPPFAQQTFRSWFKASERERSDSGKPVVLFVDSFTNYFTPDVSDDFSADSEWLKTLKPITEAVDQESRELKARVGQSEQASPRSVELETARGPLDYVLPLSLEETLSSREVGELLSPSGNPNRTMAQRRRQSNELLGVEISVTTVTHGSRSTR